MEAILKYKNTVIAIIIIVAFAWVLNNMNTHYIRQEKRLAVKEQELKDGKKTIEKWSKLQGDFRQLGKEFFAKDTLLVKSFVEEKAQANRVDIVNLSSTVIDEDFYWKVEVKVRTICEYEDFIELIKALEDKNINVQGMKISRDKNKIKADATLKGIVIK